MGVSATTKLYGFYKPVSFLFGNKIDRIRHVMTPSIGFGYTPDFGDPRWGYYDTYTKSVRDASNPNIYHDSEVQYSHYQGSLYGVPGTGKSGSINFSLGNNVEMKVRNDKDTTGTNPFKKISLIDNFSISGNYNLAIDSMRWSVFSTSLRIKITDSYSLSLSAGFDPYMYGLNSNGNPVRINKLRWENGRFPRFQGTSTSYSYTMSNDTFKKLFGKKKERETQTSLRLRATKMNKDRLTRAHLPVIKKRQRGDDGYQKITIPWSISIKLFSSVYA